MEPQPPESGSPGIDTFAAFPSHNVSSPTTEVPWTDIMSKKNVMKKTTILTSEVIDGVATATIPEEILHNAQPLWSKFIVGYFIGDAPHIGKVHATVNQIWGSPEKSSKIDSQFLNPKTVLFRIENDKTRSRVLRRHFWHIFDVPLVVQEWSPRTSSMKPDLSSMPLWVDFTHVPDHLFSHKGLMYLGDLVGDAQKLHPNTERCIRLDVARVLVVVNLDKPLPEKICLQSEHAISISVSYQWLPPRCLLCQSWGHKYYECSHMKKGSVVLAEKSDEHVRQSPIKSILKANGYDVHDLDGSDMGHASRVVEEQVEVKLMIKRFLFHKAKVIWIKLSLPSLTCQTNENNLSDLRMPYKQVI